MTPTHTPFASRVWPSLRAVAIVALLVLGMSFQTAFAASPQTVTFDNVPGVDMNTELDGKFPQDLIDWGSGAWYLSGPWQELSGNSISFNGEGINTASFSFLSPRQLLSLDAYNGGEDSATVTLSCPGQSDMQVQLAANQLRTLSTGWSANCSQVTWRTATLHRWPGPPNCGRR